MKRLLAAAPFIIFILYLIAVYPFPERFPFLSSPSIASILLIFTVGFWTLEYRGEQSKSRKVAVVVRNIIFILMGLNLFFFPGEFFFSDNLAFFNKGIGSPIISIILLAFPDWKIFDTKKSEYVSQN